MVEPLINRNWKDLEGNYPVIIQILSQNLPEGTKENDVKSQSV
jgi:hypothetical protein